MDTCNVCHLTTPYRAGPQEPHAPLMASSLAGDRAGVVGSGAQGNYRHTLSNNATVTATFSLAVISIQGWSTFAI